MSSAYSIDLAIHTEATGGRSGKKQPEHECYPLQIALVRGTLIPEGGPYTGFEPEALASFHEIKERDTIIFRVFDTRAISHKFGRSLRGVGPIELAFTDLQGRLKSKGPWRRDEGLSMIKFDENQLSLAFTSARGGMSLPCYHEYQERPDEIIVYTVDRPERESDSYLFSVIVAARIGEHPDPKQLETFYYKDDPEMVISPDGSPPGGDPTGSGDSA